MDKIKGESSKASSSRTPEKVYRDLYVEAYWEIMRVAKCYYNWVRKLPELRDAEIYADRIEMSREDAVIPMPASALVSMMMNVKEWEKTFLPIVYGSSNFNTGNPLLSQRSRIKALEVVGVLTKFQIPTSFEPMWDFSCLRYLTEITQGVYAIIDVSRDLNNPIRKSGVIIRDKGQISEIIWIESVPESERRETIYSSIINLKLVFEPKHWINTLLWNLKRQCSGADRTLLEIADNMKLFYKECVAYEPDRNKFEVFNYGAAGEYRLMGIKRCIAQDKMDLLARICVTSFAINDLTPLQVFEILVKMNVQLLFSSLSGPEEPEQVLKLDSDDGSNSITLHRKLSTRDNFVYNLQEASRSDYCSFVISRPMTTREVQYYIVNKMRDPSKEELESTAVSGFAIMPKGTGGLNSSGCLVTYVMQLNPHPQISFSQTLKEVVNDLNKTGLKMGCSLFSCMPFLGFGESD
ncbi:hypothetical protein COLO4_32623 [Corchorus olitorius]|uniref:Uncharacterized protein n=1 Tax=Corchorus olitorius TaxID=93759 RepID=A0A1R3GZ38_9ROSI|nr:hypothetical protein COLO4_32623 [Corchorus olitorius]